MVRSSTTESTILPASEIVGDYIGRLGKLDRCWHITDSLRISYEKIRRAILDLLEGHVGSVSSQSFVTIAAYMIGTRRATAAPTVLFVSEDANCRKDARRLVKDSKILSPFPGWKTAHASRDPSWGGTLEQLAADYFSVCDTRRFITRVLYNPAQPISPQGMTLYLEFDSSVWHFTANFIRLNGKPLFLGPAHAFFVDSAASGAVPDDPDDDFDIDSDGETNTVFSGNIPADLDVIEVDSELELSSEVSGDSNTSNECSDNDDSSQSSVDCAGPRATPGPNSNDTASSFARNRSQRHVNEPLKPPLSSLAPFGILSKWSIDKDWAVVEVHEENDTSISAFCTADHVDLSTFETARPGSAGATVQTHTTSGGRLAGTILGTTSDLRVPCGKSFQEVFSVRLDTNLAPGDCGSMVVDSRTGELYGHIVAGCRAAGFAYAMAASHTLPDVIRSFSEPYEDSNIAGTDSTVCDTTDLSSKAREAYALSNFESRTMEFDVHLLQKFDFPVASSSLYPSALSAFWMMSPVALHPRFQGMFLSHEVHVNSAPFKMSCFSHADGRPWSSVVEFWPTDIVAEDPRLHSLSPSAAATVLGCEDPKSQPNARKIKNLQTVFNTLFDFDDGLKVCVVHQPLIDGPMIKTSTILTCRFGNSHIMLDIHHTGWSPDMFNLLMQIIIHWIGRRRLVDSRDHRVVDLGNVEGVDPRHPDVDEPQD